MLSNLFTECRHSQGRITNNFYLFYSIVTSVDVVEDLIADEVVHSLVTFIRDKVVIQCVDIFSTLKPSSTVNKRVTLNEDHLES
jgi:hypothetical protein